VSGIEVIAISALIATANVIAGPTEKTIEGGSLGIQATKLCIADERDINEGFILNQYDGVEGRFEVRCQTFETSSGLYYASKGYYYTTPMFKTMIEKFEEYRSGEGF